MSVVRGISRHVCNLSCALDVCVLIQLQQQIAKRISLMSELQEDKIYVTDGSYGSRKAKCM